MAAAPFPFAIGIVLPIRDREGRVFACLDVDSDRLDAFDREDEEGLKKILSLLFD